ncbi:Hypothetical predicted protein [Pelobates cultripes]|uniref:Uncharacterized protein n=1 Tax=Pelobates cultripes TaxID=61616 RepID=A0AAD1S727_PELCU|nr:Hypothetical predicted protein [Pelobates cultripes]
MADGTAAAAERQRANDWAEAFMAKFDAICRRFWRRLENNSQTPVPTLANAKAGTMEPSPAQLGHLAALSPPRKQGSPEMVKIQSPDSGTPRAPPARDVTGRQNRGEPRAARQRSSPVLKHRPPAAALRAHPSLPHRNAGNQQRPLRPDGARNRRYNKGRNTSTILRSCGLSPAGPGERGMQPPAPHPQRPGKLPKQELQHLRLSRYRVADPPLTGIG